MFLKHIRVGVVGSIYLACAWKKKKDAHKNSLAIAKLCYLLVPYKLYALNLLLKYSHPETQESWLN